MAEISQSGNTGSMGHTFGSRWFAAASKLRRVMTSDLTLCSKLHYLADEVRLRFRESSQRGSYDYRLRGGTLLSLREGSTDRRVFDEVFLERIYAPFAKSIPAGLKPQVLLDLGANIGLSAIYLARALHITDIVAVEPDQDNFALLQENLTHSGLLGTRVNKMIGINRISKAIAAFAGAERGFAQVVDSGNGAWGLRMGSAHAQPWDDAAGNESVPVMPLTDLIPRALDGTPLKGLILKCDIEGAEQHLFPSIRQWDDCVDFIILELHTEFFTAVQLREALETSNYQWHMHGELPAGALLAVIALERGTRKPIEIADPRPLPSSPSRIGLSRARGGMSRD